jgi:RHS repeat-associated protein
MTKVLISDDMQINYMYSGDGKLASKIIGDSVIYYIYEGLNKIAELDGGDNVLAKYSSGLMLDKPISQCRAGNYYYYHFDALGSVTELTDENENIKNIYRYNAFGEISVETETIKNDYKYTAREHESAIDLYHYRARFYNPVIGRFISKDPYPENYLYPLSFNRYIYTLNNPVIYTDPLGLYTKTWTRFKTKINTYYEKRNIVYTQRIKVFFFFWSCKGSYDYYKIKETTVTEIIYTLTISISPLDFEFNTETYIHPPKIEETFLGKKNNVSWTE